MTGVAQAAGALRHNTVWCVGGRYEGTHRRLRTVKAVNPNTGESQEGPQLPFPSAGGCAVAYEDSLWYLDPGSFDADQPARLL